MNKEEFLQGLKEALAGSVPQSVIQENIRYYDSYIMDEVRKGAREDEVLAEIGDPRLIAKTIEETTIEGNSSAYFDDSGSGQRQTGNPYRQEEFQGKSTFRLYDLNKWYWKLLLAFVVIGFFFLVFTIIGGIFALLQPLIVPLCIVLFVMYIFKAFQK